MLDLVRRECKSLFVAELTDHLHAIHPVEDAVAARETLSILHGVVKGLPCRRRKVMESVVNLQPIRQAAANMVVNVRKARIWRAETLVTLKGMLEAA